MKLSMSSQCLKYLMFLFNLLFVITGIVVITIGAGVYGLYYEYQHFLDQRFLSVPTLLIVLGAIIFVFAFLGCCGAVRESNCLLITFTTFLVLAFILELAGGISGYVLRNHADQIVKDKMMESMKQYNESTEVTFIWDNLQKELHCCGTMNSTDWDPEFHGNLPLTCCDDSTGLHVKLNCTEARPDHYKNGCYPQFLDIVKAHALQLGGFALGVALVQALGIWLSISLARSIRNSYESV